MPSYSDAHCPRATQEGRKTRTLRHNDCGGLVDYGYPAYSCAKCKRAWNQDRLAKYNDEELGARFHFALPSDPNGYTLVFVTEGKACYGSLVPSHQVDLDQALHGKKYEKVQY